MTEFLSFFTIKAALCVVAVLMLVLGFIKLYDIMEKGERHNLFSLKVQNRWMTLVARALFYGGLLVIAFAVINIIVGMGITAPFWVYWLVFSFYMFIGYVAELVLLFLGMLVSAILLVLATEIQNRLPFSTKG